MRPRLTVEDLEERITPVIFNNINTEALLRAALDTANGNNSASNTFILTGNVTLATANVGNLQENADQTGDLDLFNNTGGTTQVKTYIFQGGGFSITQTVQDRVFQIIAGVPTNGVGLVQFQDITITGGQAVDNGTAGALAFSTDAKGGGVLNLDPINNTGGDLAFTSATVQNNSAIGGGGGPGANGFNAQGGGLFSQGGALTISASKFLQNFAHAGDGGGGIAGVDVGGPASTGGVGGNGGNGGNGQGGGLWVNAANFTIDNASHVKSNAAIGGRGGDGGVGGLGGGQGGKGGTGGTGGSAQGGGVWVNTGNVTVDHASSVSSNSVSARGGGDGGGGRTATGSSGTGGTGGNAGTGGAAEGGGIWVMTGAVTLDNASAVNSNSAAAGPGGRGGDGGQNASFGVSGYGGAGGKGGGGGAVHGAGIFAGAGNVLVDHGSQVNENSGNPSTSKGSAAGKGGDGGRGGRGGTSRGYGGKGGDAGPGGVAEGGGIYAGSGAVMVDHSATVQSNIARGGSGGTAGNGGDGYAKATSHASGHTFFVGGSGGSGGDGGVAQGGGIFAVSGAVTVDNTSTLLHNGAFAGHGGDGGDGGVLSVGEGGNGGNGGNGANVQGGGIWANDGDVRVDHSSHVATNRADAGHGGGGGHGGNAPARGGKGGNGEAGGDAQGGGIWVLDGKVTVDHSSGVAGNTAIANMGGKGGHGGDATGMSATGGNGGDGGDAGVGKGGGIWVLTGDVLIDNSSAVTGNNASGSCGGSGGHGGSANVTGGLGGKGGTGKDGGAGEGGGIWVLTGNVTVDHSSGVAGNVASGCVGGTGGDGGDATVEGRAGGDAGAGGAGGAGQGGGIWVQTGNVVIDNSSAVIHNAASAGAGVVGGDGGNGSAQGGKGGKGGDGGSAQGGGVWVMKGNVTVDHSSGVASNAALGCCGGVGGRGGDGRSPAGAGGTGGDGGAGGAAEGGGIWVHTGDVLFENSSGVDTNGAIGGQGGHGGHGGDGGNGSGTGFSNAHGGQGGKGGDGGDGHGGGIWVLSGNITVESSAEVRGNGAGGSAGSDGGAGGDGGNSSSPGIGGQGSDGGDGGTGQGGGIWLGSGAIVLDLATVARNFADGFRAGDGGPGGNAGGGGGNGGNGGAAQGGGVYLGAGTLTMTDVSVRSNAAGSASKTARGGSGRAGGSGGNGGDVQGAGLFIGSGTVSINSSTIAKNVAHKGGDGGSGNSGPGGAAAAGGDGGNVQGAALYVKAGRVTLTNDTISTNTAATAGTGGSGAAGGTGGTAGSSRGGGLFVAGGTVRLVNDTVTLNVSQDEGGGVRNEGTLGLINTIIGDDTSVNTNQADLSNAGTFLPAPDQNNNLIENPNGHTITNGVNGNIVGLSPNLGPLKNNGGPTFTHLPLPGSPAIGAGTPNGAPSTDQRGVARPSSVGAIDIGSVQVSLATTTTLVSSLNPAQVGQTVTLMATVTASDGSSVSTGTVTFTVDGSVVATVPLTNGVATFSTSTLSAGSHAVTASYSGFVGAFALGPSSATLTEVITSIPRPPSNGFIVVGTDAGIVAEVKVFDAQTGALKFDLLPFNAFTGGVRVAVGDVNGDGTPDIVVGAGPGGGPQVRVYDGTTGLPFAGNFGSFYGIVPSTFGGGIFVAAGDVNGDGFADIIVGADAGGGPQVEVWDGKTGQLLESFNAFSPGFTGGVRVAAGDVNGDGKADIITGAGKGGGPQVTVFRGADLAILSSFYAFPSNFTGGVYVAAGDVNRDGKADIITGAGPSGGPQITVFDGVSHAILASFYDPRAGGNFTVPFAVAEPGIRVGATTVNGKVRILAGPGAGLPLLIDVYDSANLGLLDSFFAFDPSYLGGVFVGG